MKKFITAFMLLSAIMVSGQAYNWEQLAATPYLPAPGKMVFVNDSVGWINNGSINRTDDGGTTFEIIYNNPFTARDIFFYDEDYGVMTGTEGKIRISEDGGYTWVNRDINGQEGNFTITLAVIVAPDTLVAWSSGIKYSTNNGNSWTNIAELDSVRITKIYFLNKHLGWMAGFKDTGPENGFPSIFKMVFYKTMDGGVTWTEHLFEDFIFDFIFDFYFSDPLHGVACGRDGLIAYTSDGGLTWTKTFIDADDFRSLAFNDSVFFMSSISGRIFISLDFGITWKDIKVKNNKPIISISTLNDSTLLANGVGGTILKSINNGSNWQFLNNGLSGGNSKKSYWVNDSELWSLNDFGLLYSEDGGNTWQEKYLDHFFTFNDFDVVPELNTIWIVGNELFETDYSVAFTEDNGDSWNVLSNLPAGVLYQNISVLGPETVVVAGLIASQLTGIFKTTDKGETWSFLETLQGQIMDMTFPTPENGYIITNGSYYATENGGNNWENQTDELGLFVFSFSDIDFYDANVGVITPAFLIDTLGYLVPGITFDGGATWNPIITSFMPDLVSVSSPEIIFVASQANSGDGVMALSTDSGQSWEMILDTVNLPINTIESRGLSVLVSGDKGHIYMGDPLVTGIKEQSKKTVLFDVYPNPASDKLTIQLVSEGRSIEGIEIFDMNGKAILNLGKQGFIRKGQLIEVPLNGIGKGFYLLAIYMPDGLETRKIIVR